MGRKVSSSRRSARCKSWSQLRQSVTGTSLSPSVVVVPITPHTRRSSSTTPRSTDMRFHSWGETTLLGVFLVAGGEALIEDMIGSRYNSREEDGENRRDDSSKERYAYTDSLLIIVD